LTHPHFEYPLPAKLASETVRVIPLGGVGEIGRNMTVFETKDSILIVDCGVLFPDDVQPGVDLILPDFDYLRDKWDKLAGVVITHGHEDHMGAIPYLLREVPSATIYGSRLALAFIEAKLSEHRIKADTRAVKEGDTVYIGDFEVGFLAVTHSIPDALALSIKAFDQLIVHTGDFKMDQLPLDGRVTDLNGFARLGDEGIDLLLSDSTNAEVPGFVAMEKDIQGVLESVMLGSRGRVVVASFASHVHRVQQVINAAHIHGRKVTYVGRSMVRNMKIASDLGYLEVPPGVMINLDQVDSYKDDEVVLITTGSQGEPMAALSRMAGMDHKIRLTENDTVILASSMIPGNEDSVNRVINGLTRLGARVVHSGNAKVHVSGHAAAGELLHFYNITKPKNLMPVHGEPRHLVANSRLAIQTGVKNVVLVEDGLVTDLHKGKAKVVGAVPCGYVFVDGSSVGSVAETSLKDRRILGEEGFISVVVVVDAVEGKVIAGPEVHARGFSENEAVFAKVVPLIKNALEEALRNDQVDTNTLQKIVRRTTGKWVAEQHRRKPMIIPVVVEA
jgi:ribonuclease J